MTIDGCATAAPPPSVPPRPTNGDVNKLLIGTGHATGCADTICGVWHDAGGGMQPEAEGAQPEADGTPATEPYVGMGMKHPGVGAQPAPYAKTNSPWA